MDAWLKMGPGQKKLFWQTDLFQSFYRDTVNGYELTMENRPLPFSKITSPLGHRGGRERCHHLLGVHFIKKTRSRARQLTSIPDIVPLFQSFNMHTILFLFVLVNVYFPLSFFLVSSWNDKRPISFFSLFSSMALYYRCLLWIRYDSVSKSWQAFSCSYVTLGRQLSAVQNVFLSIICTLKSLADTLTYSQWPSKSIAHLSDILFWINKLGQCEKLKEWKEKCWKYTCTDPTCEVLYIPLEVEPCSLITSVN